MGRTARPARPRRRAPIDVARPDGVRRGWPGRHHPVQPQVVGAAANDEPAGAFGGPCRRSGRGPASRAAANRSMPRWTVGASIVASRTASMRRASPQRPTAPVVRGRAASSPIARGGRSPHPASASTGRGQVERPDGSGIGSKTGARRQRGHAAARTGASPAASRSTAVASGERHRRHRLERGPLLVTRLVDVHVVGLQRRLLVAADRDGRRPCHAPSARPRPAPPRPAAASGRKPRAISRASWSGCARSWKASAAIVTASSAASHVRDRSPKSMSPAGIGRPARSRRVTVLRSVTSAWIVLDPELRLQPRERRRRPRHRGLGQRPPRGRRSRTGPARPRRRRRGARPTGAPGPAQGGRSPPSASAIRGRHRAVGPQHRRAPGTPTPSIGSPSI